MTDPMTLYDLLERHVAGGDGRERPLVVSSEGTFTSAHVARESARLAAWLASSPI